MITHKKFPLFLRRSFYIHCILISLGLVGGKVILSQKLNFQNKNLELVRASVRVDMVAMPEHTLEELKSLTPDTPATPEVPKAEVKVEAQTETKEITKSEIKLPDDKHQSFLAKLKHISGKKISKSNDSNAKELKQLVLAGNKLSKGTEAYGDRNTGDQTAFQVYVSKLPQKVKPFWRLPSFLLEKKLKCRVRVWIAMSGHVSRAEIYQSSGDSEYDQKSLDAVNAASPFPQLSEEFGRRALNGDILLGFPL